MNISKNTIIKPLLALFFLVGLMGCGAYFNTFYNTKKLFNEAEKKRIEQQKKEEKKGEISLGTKPVNFQEYTKAIEKGSKVLELYPNSRYVDDAIMIIGQSFYHTGNYIKARRKFEELVTYFPKSEYAPRAKLWLGKSLIAQNDFSQAKIVLNELTTQDVDEDLAGEAQTLLGELYFSQEDYPAAIKEFENTITKISEKKNKILTLMRIGQCYRETKEFSKSAEMFRRALDMKPDIEQFYLVAINYGQALRDLRKYKSALDFFDKMTKEALTKDELANVRLEIAATLSKIQEYEKAKITYEDIIQEFPNTDQAAKAYYRLGLMAIDDFGDFSYAKDQFDVALQKSPRASISDSIRMWSNNLKKWDDLYFETSVLKQAFLHIDPISVDTVGEYTIKEQENRFASDFFTHQGSVLTKEDSLKKVVQDSIRADSLKKINNQDQFFTDPDSSNHDHGLNKENAKNKNQVLPQTNKILKQVTVPKNPSKLQNKLIKTTNQIAELYFLQFDFPDSALKNYEFLIQNFPNNELYPHWMYTSAYLLEQMGEKQESDSLYTELINQFPETEYAAQAQKIINDIEIEMQKDPAENLFRKAEIKLFDDQSVDSSLIIYNRIVEQYQDSEYAPKALYTIAWIFESIKNNNEKALEVYNQLNKNYPNSIYAKKSYRKIAAVEKARELEDLNAQKQMADTLQTVQKDSVSQRKGARTIDDEESVALKNREQLDKQENLDKQESIDKKGNNPDTEHTLKKVKEEGMQKKKKKLPKEED